MFQLENHFKNANIPRTIRFTEKLYRALNKTAAENDISLNFLVLKCCQYALDHMDQNKGRELKYK